MRSTIAILLVAIGFCAAAQQPLGRKWDARFGGVKEEAFYKIFRLPDGGYAMGGISDSAQDGDKTSPQKGYGDYYIVRTDSIGNKLWDKSYGGSSSEVMFSMCLTSDGGFLLAGHSGSGAGGDKTEPGRGGLDYWVVRLDADGNKLWDRRFGGASDEILGDARQCADGGFILTGFSESNAGGDKSEDNGGARNGWVVRIDSLGNKLWDETYRSRADMVLWAGSELADGGFLFAGSAAADSTFDISEHGIGIDFWAVRTDAWGAKIWDRRYEQGGSDWLRAMVEANNGDFVLFGQKNTIDILVRIDTVGNRVWEKEYYSGGQATDISATQDGGFLVSEYTAVPKDGDKTELSLGNTQTWVLKIDSAGNKVWDKTIFTWSDNAGYAIESTPGCIVVGTSCRGGIGGYKTQPNWDTSLSTLDFWLVELCEGWVDTTLCPQQPCTGITETPTLEAKLYPNPTTGTLTIELPTGQEGIITLYNLLGQNVFNAEVIGTTTLQTDLPKGVYIYRIAQGGKYMNGKLVVE